MSETNTDIEVRPERDAEVFEKMTGLKLPDRFTGGMQSNDQLAQADARKLENMPSFAEACENLIAEVGREQRQDHSFELQNCHIDERGRFSRRDGAALDVVRGLYELDMLPIAWNQLAAKAPRDVDPKLRTNINSWIHRKSSEGVFRTMNTKPARKAFAVVTPKFQAFDADEICKSIISKVPSECKGKVKYLGDGGRYEIDAILGKPFDVDGDLHRIMVSVRSADNGTLAQKIYFKAYRLKCTNGIYVMQRSLIASVRHMGDREIMAKQFEHGYGLALEAIDAFKALWGWARQNQFVCPKTGDLLDGPEALKRLAMHKKVHVPHQRPKALLEKLNDSFHKEPGNTIADVLNAVTRTAHASAADWRSKWFENDLEEQAGSLLTAPKALPPLTEKQLEALNG